MKRFLSILFTILICLGVFATYVYAANSDLLEESITGNGTALTTEFTVTTPYDYYIMAKCKFTVQPNTAVHNVTASTFLIQKTGSNTYTVVETYEITKKMPVQNALSTTQSIEYRKSGFLDDPISAGTYLFMHEVKDSSNRITSTFTTIYS